MSRFYLNSITLAISAVALAANATAQTQNQTATLDEVVVYANQNMGLSSIQSISKQKIKNTPNGNGNVTDYLKNNPSVRFEQSDQNGLQRGELKPENVSINGADPNQTAYFVDNVNINNDLMADNEIFDGSMQVVPGLSHTQGYFFDANLLSSIAVYDSNVSASLGGFAGGAVVAKTKQYDGTDRVKLNYRTTGSSWAKLHSDEASRSKLNAMLPEATLSAPYQPDYKKHFFNIMAEKSLTDELGMVIGLSRRASNIKQSQLVSKEGKRDTQYYKFRSDNLLTNFNWTPNDDNRFELGLRYSNYRESKFYPNTLGNNVVDYHQAYGATLAWVKALESGVLTSTLAYDKLEDKRRSGSSDVEIVSIYDDNYDVIADYEIGGYGNSRLGQKNLHFSTEYAVNPFNWGAVNHSISLGGLYQLTKYHFKRDQDVYGKITMVYPDFEFAEDSELKARRGTVKTDYQNFALYLEDLMAWKNFEFRAGLRLEQDDYLKNTNLAPRFVTKWKADENTAMTLGLNRYYGRSFASLKLTDKILALNENETRRYEKLSSLKTPYSNEFSLGLEHNWRNVAFNLKYIHRQNKHRIVLDRYQEDGENIDVYRNGKPYSSDIYTLEMKNIEPLQWGASYWNASFAFDWLDTRLNDLHRTLNGQDTVFLDGQAMSREQMRRKVNSGVENWTTRLNLEMNLPDYGITWANQVWIKSPVKGYEEIDDPVYRSFNYGTHTQWDMRVRWQPKISSIHKPYVQFDLLNVLDKTRKVSKRSGADNFGEYTPGREFWLEVGYEF